MEIPNLKDILPKDMKKHASRDLSVFAGSIFGETYVKSLYKLFGVGFSSTLWTVHNGNFLTFYRSESEHLNFREQIGKKATDKVFAFELALKLREYTAWIYEFLEQNKDKDTFIKNKDAFVQIYMDFFAYHQATYWASHYLHESHPDLKTHLTALDSAYRYNENVVPDVEAHLKSLDLTKYPYYDLENPHEDIGFMWFSPWLLKNSVKEIEDYIQSKEEKDYSGVKEMDGLAANNKSIQGKVKVITDFYKLGEVQPDEILVTEMTRPQYNEIMAKCRGLITDEGGMLCHASILAREADLPCIVGTGIATKALKDGDFVEIDGERGIVKILERVN